MKKLNYFLLLFVILFTNSSVFSQSFVNISPKDNSILVSLSTDIILKSSEIINPASLSSNEFSVSGTVSGKHTGTVKLSDDNKTVLFIPLTPFSANEDVSVNVNQGIKTTDGAALPEVTIHFKTTPLTQRININPLTLMGNEPLNKSSMVTQTYTPKAKISSITSLPSDFPGIVIDSSNNPSDGKLFLTNFSLTPNASIGNYLMILNNDGSPVKYKKLSQSAFDFKVLPNGELSYSDVIVNDGAYGQVRWIVMDTSLTPVDTFQCGNGYSADLHDFLLLPNGHALMFAYDPEPVDMSQYGGNPNAIVIGAVIQEIDASKNVVFQWRTWDYLPITDSYIDLTTSTVDLIHANAFDADNDGNILLSMRHLSTIIKIDRQTGNIDWILGGKQNQFTFLNEHESNAPNYFSFQHNVQVLPDGDITLFDNGNQHSPEYSRAVEYKLDEQNKTADLVWDYRHTPDIYSYAMGSVQRLANGNTFIGWGIASSTGSPVLTEVKPDNSTALELSLSAGQMSYRSYKFQWASGLPSATVTVDEILQGNTYKFNSSNDTTGITIKFDQVNSSLYPNTTVTRYNYSPKNPVFTATAPVMVSNYFNIKGTGVNSYTGEVQVNLYDYPAVINPKTTIIYARSDSNNAFAALPTSYDSTKDELTFATSTSGDFAFGIPQTVDSSYAPAPISPTDSTIVLEGAPVKLVWGTRGIVQTYHLQVSNSSSFSSLIVDNPSLSSTSFTVSSVNNNSTYYWRVSNTNAAGTSNWSNIESFSTSPAFIKILSPNGGEKLYTDSTFVIRWDSNISDTVSIKLMDGNNIASVIGDTIVGGTNAYEWQIPVNLKPDTSYKIIVSDVSNSGLSALSGSSFTITSGVTSVTGVGNSGNTIKSYELSQNYPNPFNPSTVIKYSIPQESHVRIDIFNVIGQRITTLVNATQNPGNYAVTMNGADLASGVYFYSIRASGNSGNNFFTVKKMILLK